MSSLEIEQLDPAINYRHILNADYGMSFSLNFLARRQSLVCIKQQQLLIWFPWEVVSFPPNPQWNRTPNSVFVQHSLYCLFPGGSEDKASACNAGDLGSIPGLGRSPREGNGNPLQYSCLENPMDRGAWWATAHTVAKSRTRLSDFTSYCLLYFYMELLMNVLTFCQIEGISN